MKSDSPKMLSWWCERLRNNKKRIKNILSRSRLFPAVLLAFHTISLFASGRTPWLYDDKRGQLIWSEKKTNNKLIIDFYCRTKTLLRAQRIAANIKTKQSKAEQGKNIWWEWFLCAARKTQKVKLHKFDGGEWGNLVKKSKRENIPRLRLLI